MLDLPPSTQLSWTVSDKRSAKFGPLFHRKAATRALHRWDNWSEPATDTNELGAEQPFLKQVANDPVTWAAAADGIVAGASILESFLEIDPQVLHAIQFSTAQDLHGLADIHSYVQSHFFSSPVESADGWFNRLTGYVAEQKAASFFEHTGHHVVFAPISNQPAWDMLVDGHPVQIKENLGALKDFAVAHPGIPAYTDPHIAAELHTASVHGLSVLDKDSIHAAATHTVEGLDGTFDPGFNFPFITMAFSAYREIKLLLNEQTTFDRALLNVGMDVAGVGMGMFAGGKVGAFVGSIIPGPGTVIGGLLGSVIGGITGKLASTGVRQFPFHSACEEYNDAIESAKLAISSNLEASRAEVQKLQKEYQFKFRSFRSETEASAMWMISALEQEYQNKLGHLYARFPEFLLELREQLCDEEQEVLSVMAQPGLLQTLFAGEGFLKWYAVRRWFARAKRTVRKQSRAYRRLKPRDAEILHSEVRRILEDFAFDLNILDRELADIAAFQDAYEKQASEIRRRAVTKTEEYRQTLIRDFGSRVSCLHDGVVQVIQDWNTRISIARSELRREAAAVGISI